MRLGVGEAKGSGSWSGLSTVKPVVFGDNGEAIMGAGRVCRLRAVGVRCSSVKLFRLIEPNVAVSAVYGRRDAISIVREVEGEEVGLAVSNLAVTSLLSCTGVRSSVGVSARVRSSHLPRTTSRLVPARWLGVHLRFGVPVGLLSNGLLD
jgi:hypothetical protein